MTSTRTPGQKFLGFFFAPTDPTTMAFIRIVTGCLILYTHAAHSFDLQNFFGEKAFYDTQAINRERREVPHSVPPPVWEDPYFPIQIAQMPDQPHRRTVVIAFVRKHLGPDCKPADIDRKFAFITRLQAIDQDQIQRRVGQGGLTWQGMSYISNLATDPLDRSNQLAVLADPTLHDAKKNSRVPPLPIYPSPDAVNFMTLAQREEFAREAEEFYRTLPENPDHRSVVLMFWGDMDYGQREATLKMYRRLAAASAEERAKQLDYFEYWNVDPGIVHRFGTPIFSLWFHITDPWEMRIAHTGMLLVFALFTLGLFTRVTSVLTWFAILTYIHRTQQIVFGMDTMMNILMIYLMISNCGATLSLDRLLNRYRAVKASLSRTGTLDAATLAYLHTPPLSVTTGFAQRLLQMHFCFIYMASGLSKLKGTTWWNTNAYWDTLVNPEFTLVYYQWYEELLRWVISSRPVYAAIATFGVGFTFFAEIGLPFFVWTRLRPYAVIMGCLLHFGIGLFMGLIVFSLFMMTMLLVYLPGEAVRERLFALKTLPPRWRLRYDPASLAQVDAAAIRIAADFCGQTTAVPEAKATLTREPITPNDNANPHAMWQTLLTLLTFVPRKLGF